MTPVTASDESMSLENQIKNSVSSAKDIVNRVSARSVLPKEEIEIEIEEEEENDGIKTGYRHSTIETPQEKTIRNCDFNGRKISTPAGRPPFKPEGYKAGWPNGPASDEAVRKWALEIYNADGGRYKVEAVVYWSRYFWDIHSKEFLRITDLILDACS